MEKKENDHKKITASLIASATAFSMFVSAYACEAEEKDHVMIGGYECYVRDGRHYTEIDGETCLVIDLDEGAAEYDGSNISL